MTTIREFRVAILTGSKNDLEVIHASKLLDILKDQGVAYDIEVISSDREPERLRSFCIERRANLSAVIAIAGGVPNLPICAKAWMPEVFVLSVPLGEERDYALAALTTPGNVPVAVAGFGKNGLEKAARIVANLGRLVGSMAPCRSSALSENPGERS